MVTPIRAREGFSSTAPLCSFAGISSRMTALMLAKDFVNMRAVMRDVIPAKEQSGAVELNPSRARMGVTILANAGHGRRVGRARLIHLDFAQVSECRLGLGS